MALRVYVHKDDVECVPRQLNYQKLTRQRVRSRQFQNLEYKRSGELGGFEFLDQRESRRADEWR